MEISNNCLPTETSIPFVLRSTVRVPGHEGYRNCCLAPHQFFRNLLKTQLTVFLNRRLILLHSLPQCEFDSKVMKSLPDLPPPSESQSLVTSQ
uniref:Uncharacterized protein n=1 Tax=Salix viminalis TaxID=40686 RepID=A0A6N2MLZ9_SALVM